jgi:hypothetical protein
MKTKTAEMNKIMTIKSLLARSLSSCEAMSFNPTHRLKRIRVSANRKRTRRRRRKRRTRRKRRRSTPAIPMTKTSH